MLQDDNERDFHSHFVLESRHSKCTFCSNKLVVDEKSRNKKLISVYTRQGTSFAQHLSKKCQNYKCRASHYYGYSVRDNVRSYDLDVLQSCTYLG